VQPLELIQAEEEAQLSCDLISDIGEAHRMTFLSSDFATTAKLEAVLCKNTIALSFFGSESDLKLFKIELYTLPWKRQHGVRATGVYLRDGQLVFVDTQGAVTAGGVEYPGLVQMSRYKQIASGLMKASFLDREMLFELAEHVFSYNEPAKTVPVLAWCAGCFIKPHLRHCEVKYPHLFLIGEQGSGKSNTLERFIQPLFSCDKILAASQVTAFTLMKEANSSNIFPQAIDEFKPSKLDKLRVNCLYNLFRDAYDLHDGMRGQADQSILTYELLAPIVVAGEESPDESALRERSIEILFSKKDIASSGGTEHFIWLLDHQNALSRLGRSLLDCALATGLDEVRGWFTEGKGLFDRALTVRIRDNLSCLYCGLCLLAKLCGRLGLPWPFEYDRETCARHIEYSVKEYLLDGGSHNRTIVEQSFEVMSRMNLKPGVDFAFEQGTSYLCLWLAGMYDRFTRFKKDCAIAGEALPYSQFRKQLEHSEFFVEKNRVKRMGEELKRVWVLDFGRLSSCCDVAGFVKEAAAGEAEPAL
jgi:hypothetical protein